MERSVLHADCNKFYASVETLYHPKLNHLPFVVGGDPQNRHGIVLTKSEEAAQCGIKTGEPLWQAFQKCPELKVIPPHFERYEAYSKEIYNVYRRYTDLVEPFGLDEAWLDVTDSVNLFGNGESIAYQIKEAVKKELGLTLSIGVSFNKIFAKLGSDYKKPDAVTVFSKENFKKYIWPLPLSSLIFIGQKTAKKLENYFIYTVGDAACANVRFLEKICGKQGKLIYEYANGWDHSPVLPLDFRESIKSISNSTTPSCDLKTDEEVKQYLYLLAEHISLRMEEKNFKGKTIAVNVRDTNLRTSSRQTELEHHTALAEEIAEQAFLLFQEAYSLPIRSIGLAVTDFAPIKTQMDFWTANPHQEKLYAAETAINQLKRKYGDNCIHRAIIYKGEKTEKHSTFGHCVFNHLNYL